MLAGVGWWGRADRSRKEHAKLEFENGGDGGVHFISGRESLAERRMFHGLGHGGPGRCLDGWRLRVRIRLGIGKRQLVRRLVRWSRLGLGRGERQRLV